MSKRKHITAMWGVTKPHFEGLQRIAQKVPQLFAKKRIFEFLQPNHLIKVFNYRESF